MNLPDPPLLVISDRGQARRPLIEVAEAVFAGGVRWFSLREKDLPPAERRAPAREDWSNWGIGTGPSSAPMRMSKQ